MISLSRHSVSTLLTVSVLALSLGCAKSEEQKVAAQTQVTQADADKAVADLSSSVAQLRTAPAPAADWTPEQTKGFESLVNKTEVDLKRVESYLGKGLVIPQQPTPTEIRTLIEKGKTALLEVRNKKNAEQAATRAAMTLDQLKTRYDEQVKGLQAKGGPSPMWTLEALKDYGLALDEIEATLQQMEATGGKTVTTTGLRIATGARRAEYDLARKVKS